MSKEYAALVEKCAEDGKREMMSMACVGTIEPLHLYYVESGKGKSGQLVLQRKSKSASAEMRLACNETLGGNIPYANYFQWILNRTQNCPVLAT